MFVIVPDENTPAGPYVVGDQPGAVVAAITDDGADIELNPLWTVSGTVAAPAGTTLPLENVTVDTNLDRVLWTWPPGAFVAPGLHSVNLSGLGSTQYRTTEPLPVVVEPDDGWLSLVLARQLWPDAPRDDVALFLLLETARQACVAYAPALVAPAMPPANYLEAQLAQARSVWNLMQTAPQSDLIGYEQTAVRVYPLDYNVRQLLRPKSGIPGMF